VKSRDEELSEHTRAGVGLLDTFAAMHKLLEDELTDWERTAIEVVIDLLLAKMETHQQAYKRLHGAEPQAGAS
jgi:hypothetical protein